MRVITCAVRIGLTAGALLWAPPSGHADDGCDKLVQAGLDGMAATEKADDATIHQPEDISKFTCLGNFFQGIGIDVLASGLDPSKLVQSVAGKFCEAITSEWNNLRGSAQCGLNISGLNSNFGLGLGAGAGTICPALNLGGGGDSLISTSTNTSGVSQWNTDGYRTLPDGYSIDLIGNQTGVSVERQ